MSVWDLQMFERLEISWSSFHKAETSKLQNIFVSYNYTKLSEWISFHWPSNL